VEVELESEVNRHWSEITSREYIFNRLQLEAQMIGQLTKQDIVEFYKEHVIAPNARKLLIQVVGTGQGEETKDEESSDPELEIVEGGAGNVIKDMKKFKESLELHPVTKTVVDLL
jgi:secreted Zn-dependent insulinase-like peptidase